MGPPMSLRLGLAVLFGLAGVTLVDSQGGQFNRFSNQQNSYRAPIELYYPQVPNDYQSFVRTLMYPYDDKDRAPFDASKIEHEMALGIRLPFFGFSYTYIKIHMHGYVHFGGGPREYRLPIEFPLKPADTVSEKDPAVIAPWLTYQTLLGGTPESGVYTRLIMVKERNELKNCQRNPSDRYDCWIQKRVHDDFNGGMIGSQGFKPKFALIVTWRNMTVPQMERFGHTQKTNTYQLVLASDETTTYAMFNYDQLEWISSEDRKEGRNGLNPFIGFNAGNTTRAYEFFPYSQQPRVSQLIEGGDEKMKGRYLFQVDEEIYTGTCIDWALDPHLIKQRPRLSFFPKFANMLGGTMINVTGPCFPENAKIECQFQDMSGGRFPAIYRDRNHASCYMPPVFFHGYVDLTVTINNGDALFYGRFYIQPPELSHNDVIVLNSADKEEKPNDFIIQWTREKLTWNVNDSRSVSVHLWGFDDNQEYPSLTYITELGRSNLNSITYSLPIQEYVNSDNRDRLNLQFGFISVNFSIATLDLRGREERSPVVWSHPMPLAWYFWPQWENYYGRWWKDQFCHDWFQREREADKFAISLWRCPCTMQQSELDRGRYAPDTQCSVYTRNCDPFYKRALHCVKSGRPSVGGSGQTCCYDMEGELILTADTMYGGKPHRFFSYGVLPYNQRSKVASLATWAADMMPFFSCCQWQAEKDDSQSCQKYKWFRTSQDCSAYQPPGFAAVYGDPHFLTFDGTNYTFGGHGEFSLVRADNEKAKINVQGRFESRRREQPTDITVQGTYLSGVAVRDNVSSTVEFHLRPLAARRFYQLYLIVDNEYIYFWDEKMKTLNFKGVSIYQPTGYYNMSKIVAMFDSGAGVEVSVQHEQLVLNCFLPIEFVNITTGLLGSWDYLADNDVSSDQRGTGGGFVTTDDKQVTDFGNKHRLNESASLFNHMLFGYNFGHYDDSSFKSFSPQGKEIEAPWNATFRNRDLSETCATSRACRYDYVVTGSRPFAATTKAVEASAQMISNEVRKQVIRCQALDKPAYGLKSEIRNFVGKIVRFTCAPGYRLYGHETRQCKETGLWSWGEAPVCKSVRDHVLAMIGITLGILIPIGFLIFCCVLCCKSSKKEKDHAHYNTREQGEEKKAFTEKKADDSREGELDTK